MKSSTTRPPLCRSCNRLVDPVTPPLCTDLAHIRFPRKHIFRSPTACQQAAEASAAALPVVDARAFIQDKGQESYACEEDPCEALLSHLVFLVLSLSFHLCHFISH